MKPKYISATVAVALVLPFVASAFTADELQQQIATLLTQVAQLQEKLKSLQGAPSTPVSVGASAATRNAQYVCPTLSRNLRLGAQGQDVLSLQKFLLAQNLLGAGVTEGSFDAGTENAVRRLQVKYNVVVSGTPTTTGYGVVGPRTRALIALNCNIAPTAAFCPLAEPPATSCSTGWQANTDSAGCVRSYKCAVPLPQAATTTSTAGACTAIALWCPSGTYDQVGPNCSHTCVSGTTQPSSTLFATPTSGAAPLLVTFTLFAADTAESGGVYYTIEFGDGQATEFARIANPSIMHTYASAGTYTATVTRRTGCSSWGCPGSDTVVRTVTITAHATASVLPFSIRSPTSGQSAQQGQGLTIAWDSQNAPAGSAAAFWLVKSSGANLGLIARNQLPNGTFNWQVPGSRCNASGVCITLVDSPSAYYSDVGTYWIVGKLYSPVDAYLGGFPSANPVTPTFLATATSSLFNITE